MFGGFLCQMWDLFHQFLMGQKTVAVSFEEKGELTFPSFAFCDSRAYRKRSIITLNATLYEAVAFNLEKEVYLDKIVRADFSLLDDWENTYTGKLFPTLFNGYCKLFEFHRGFPANTIAGKMKAAKQFG